MKAEQYEVLLSVLVDKIKEQEAEIYLKDWQIEKLNKKLEEAEALLPTKTTLSTLKDKK